MVYILKCIELIARIIVFHPSINGQFLRCSTIGRTIVTLWLGFYQSSEELKMGRYDLWLNE